jgi:hypothetical protein
MAEENISDLAAASNEDGGRYSAKNDKLRAAGEMIGSSVIGIFLFFTAFMSVYYWAADGMTPKILNIDLYGSQKEWLWTVDTTTAAITLGDVASLLDPNSTDSESVFKAKMRTSNAATAKVPVTSKADRCVNYAGSSGSVYGFCDELQPGELPAWAGDWEALTIQTVYMTTIEEHKRGLSPSYLAVMQAFKNSRKNWYKIDSTDRMHCTTKNLARDEVHTATRSIWTKKHGVLTEVDCKAAENVGSQGCLLTKDGSATDVMTDGTHNPVVNQYIVLRTSSGDELIMKGWSSVALFGLNIRQDIVWPIDDCLYIRDTGSGNAIGWFGLGYNQYEVELPRFALVAKLQLIIMVSLIWFIDHRFAPLRFYRAMVKTSRLGIFHIIVAQIIFSVMSEIDILRQVYHWDRSQGSVALLYIYIIVSVSIAISMASVSVVRIYGESSIGVVGVIVALFNSLLGLAVLTLIGEVAYSEASAENGLQYVNGNDNCPGNYVNCTNRPFNYFYLSYILVVIPVLVDFVYVAIKIRPKQDSIYSVQPSGVDSLRLKDAQKTSFERVCLQNAWGRQFVRDLESPHVMIGGIPHSSVEVFESCGFTMVQNRFLIRTKDVYLLVIAKMMPMTAKRDVSTVIWPLSRDKNGNLIVSTAERVYLVTLRDYKMEGTTTSILRGGSEPLA